MNEMHNNRIEITARCIYVGPVETFSSGFTKRVIAVEWTREGSKFPTRLAFNLKKNDVGKVNEDFKGRDITVTAFVESREWTNPKNGKLQFFTELNAVKIAVPEGDSVPVPEAAIPESDPEPTAADIDDMPF